VKTTVIGLSKTGKRHVMTYGDVTRTLEAETVLKHRLKDGQELDLKTLSTIIFEDDLLVYDKIAAMRMRLPRTVHEIRTHLLSKGASDKVADTLIGRYVSYKFLDDRAYARMLVQSKRLSEGPRMIEKRLKEKGVSRADIDAAMTDYDEGKAARAVATAKLRASSRKTRLKAAQSARQTLLSKGFSFDVVDDAIRDASGAYQGDENVLIPKAFVKAERLCAKKKDASERRQCVIRKLMAEGFAYDDIKRLL
jgi:regulatory protein